MPTPVSITLLALLIVLALLGMRAGWRARTRRTADLVPALPSAPADLGSARTESVETVYVSSTRAGDWLDRVTAHDLGERSNAQVQVWDAGVTIAREGTTDVFVPASALRAVGTAPGIAGKVVGRDGLVLVTWQVDPSDERGLDTGIHPRHAVDRDVLVDAVRALIDDTAGADAPVPTQQEETA
ncbi:PH-like domain-containing protein [Cellulomonas soli]